MKIIITESQLNELFNTNNIYDYQKIKDDVEYYGLGENMRHIRYNFTTKDNVKYTVMIRIKDSGLAYVDFFTESTNIQHQSNHRLIGTHDSIKVFNTIITIAKLYEDDIKELYIDSDREHIRIYEKILRYLGYTNFYVLSDGLLIVLYLNKAHLNN